jgi:hypothetical protein
LLTGLLDGWTARHQQGLAQQREDELAQQQFAQRQQLEEERFGRETELAGARHKRALELKEIDQAFSVLLRDLDEESAMRLLKFRKSLGIDGKTEKPPKPQDPTKLSRVVKTYADNPMWAEENMSGIVTYLMENLPAGEEFMPEHYADAKREVATQNVGLTVSDPQSPVAKFVGQLKDEEGKSRSVNDQFIPAEDAAQVLMSYGLLSGTIPGGMYSPRQLAEIVVYNSPDPMAYDIIDPKVQKDLQPIGVLEGAIWEILQNYAPESVPRGGIGYGATIVGPPGSEVALPTVRGLEPVMKAIGSFVKEAPGRIKEEAGRTRPARR